MNDEERVLFGFDHGFNPDEEVCREDLEEVIAGILGQSHDRMQAYMDADLNEAESIALLESIDWTVYIRNESDAFKVAMQALMKIVEGKINPESDEVVIPETAPEHWVLDIAKTALRDMHELLLRPEIPKKKRSRSSMTLRRRFNG